MGKTVVRVTPSKRDAEIEKNAINKDFRERGIEREAYVTDISKAYVRKRTRKGYPISNKNYAICVRNKR